jgi:transposase
VGIDLHRRRSVIVRMTEAGEEIERVRIDSDPVAFALKFGDVDPATDVVLEATYGWYWAADLLKDYGMNVHLAHPLGINGFKNRRVKDDFRDAADLADLLRMDRLPEGWIAPPEIRELRELVRYRAKLVALRSGAKAQVHAVLAKLGVKVDVTDLFGVSGNELLDDLCLKGAYRLRVDSLRDLIDVYDGEIAFFDKEIRTALIDHRGYRAIQAIPGIGTVIAAILVVEIGDVTRFSRPAQLCSWAGVTPRHRESDAVVVRGHITKQGPKLVRWAIVEAVARMSGDSKQARDYRRIADRRGKSIARIAAARRLLTLVYYGLRDGHISCLERLGRAA